MSVLEKFTCIDVKWSGAYNGTSKIYLGVTGRLVTCIIEKASFTVTELNQSIHCAKDTIPKPSNTCYGVLNINDKPGMMKLNTDGSICIYHAWDESTFDLGPVTWNECFDPNNRDALNSCVVAYISD